MLHSPAIRTLALVLGAVGVIFGSVDVAVAATASALHAISDTGPLLGIWGVGALYALASRAALRGTTTEAFAWLLSASATGASIGVGAAGALSQTAGPQAAFALAAGAGAPAVLIAIAGRPSLALERPCEPQEQAALTTG